MPAYKDEKTGKWFAKFYYTNWQGIKKMAGEAYEFAE